MYQQQHEGNTEPLGQIAPPPPKKREKLIQEQFSQVVVLAMADTSELRGKAEALQLFNRTIQEVQDRSAAIEKLDQAMKLIIEAEYLIHPGNSLLIPEEEHSQKV